MPRYLFLYRGGAPEAGELSPSAVQAHLEKWDRWVQELTEKGIFEVGESLAGPSKRIDADGVVVDGPLVESKEVIGGYSLVDAGSLESAVEIARGCPIFEYDGRVEVREVFDRCMDPGEH